MSDLNFTPSSTGLESESAATLGTAESLHSVHGHDVVGGGGVVGSPATANAAPCIETLPLRPALCTHLTLSVCPAVAARYCSVNTPSVRDFCPLYCLT